MLRTIVLTLAVVALPQASALESEVLDGCLLCHKGALALDDQTSAEITVAIRAMIAGSRGHPTSIPELSAADLRELAEALADSDTP